MEKPKKRGSFVNRVMYCTIALTLFLVFLWVNEELNQDVPFDTDWSE